QQSRKRGGNVRHVYFAIQFTGFNVPSIPKQWNMRIEKITGSMSRSCSAIRIKPTRIQNNLYLPASFEIIAIDHHFLQTLRYGISSDKVHIRSKKNPGLSH